MSDLTSIVLAQTLLLQVDILQAAIKARPLVSPSTATWKEYTLSDYASTEDYCRCCLVNDNQIDSTAPLSNLCWLPLGAPEDTVNLNALQAAQQTILDPENSSIPDDEVFRQTAAKKLVSLMDFYSVKPDKKLISLANKAK